MELTLKRDESGAHSTLGELYIGDKLECFSLEDMVRVDDPATSADEGKKVYGQTAIPAGRYEIIITYSNRFGADMPLLLNVPGFHGIRIHSGNTDADTLGCILVGVAWHAESLRDSKVAYNRLFDALLKARQTGEQVWITIENADETSEI